MTPEKFDRVMKKVINHMGVDVIISYRSYSSPQFVNSKVYLYKEGSRIDDLLGFPFMFRYDKKRDTLSPHTKHSFICQFDLFRVLPPKLVNDYFINKVKKYVHQRIKEGDIKFP